ncbi:HTH domain-containing protein [Lewinella sp. IMCC34191]|uniref:HTH domain-containing protein n=1 Tax=Lewinella sp. IMCC34191 TaxID=2259172 RepID=UPI0018E4EC98|nr:HTH domain-containing protein [Lewinella sp. IMCC34191]
MNKQLERIKRMHTLIKFNRTGTPAEFAERLGISPAGLYRTLAMMKEMGAPIHFCQRRQSYGYYESVELRIDFVRVENSRKDQSRVSRGQACIRPLHTPTSSSVAAS